MRRNQCVNCGALKWVPLPERQGPAWGVIAAVVAVGVGGSALMLSGNSGASNEAVAFHRQLAVADKPRPAEPARLPEATVGPATEASLPPEPQAAALLRTADSQQASAYPVADRATEPSSSSGAAEVAEPAAPSVRELRAVTPRWTGERMEVLIETDALPPDYTLTYVASSGGYVIDIPGVWSIRSGLRRSRSFTRSNLNALDVGLHESFLRIVLRTGQRQPEPDISREAQALRILL